MTTPTPSELTAENVGDLLTVAHGMQATLTEILDRMPVLTERTDWLDEPVPVPRPEPACVCGSVDGFDCCPDPAPADVDPEPKAELDEVEALAKVLYHTVSPFGGGDDLVPWDEVTYRDVRDRWLDLARAAREHILTERGGLGAEVVPALKRQITDVEADLARVTDARDRHSRAADKWCNLYADKCEEIESVQAKADRYDALREDVKRYRDGYFRSPGDILRLDEKRAES